MTPEFFEWVNSPEGCAERERIAKRRADAFDKWLARQPEPQGPLRDDYGRFAAKRPIRDPEISGLWEIVNDDPAPLRFVELVSAAILGCVLAWGGWHVWRMIAASCGMDWGL